MMHNDMETQIHYLEQVAYSSVLQAFKAQADALTWEKEGLITELRKELRVSDDEHRQLLAKANTDDVICSIREWRKSGGNSSSLANIPLSKRNPLLQSSTGSMSRKGQLTSMPLLVHPQRPVGFGSLIETPIASTRFPPVAQIPSGTLSNNGGSSIPLANDSYAGVRNLHIGKKLFVRWPDDNNFYAATICDYNHNQGLYCLGYDKNTYEWVDFKEISPEDIQWVDEDPKLPHQSGPGGPGGGKGRGIGNLRNHGLLPVGGRGSEDQFYKGPSPLQDGTAMIDADADEIEILHTDTLIYQMEKVIHTSHPDLVEIQKAMEVVKEHERTLIEVLTKLADASDSVTDGNLTFMQGDTMNNNHGPRRLQYSTSTERPDGHLDDEYIDIV